MLDRASTESELVSHVRHLVHCAKSGAISEQDAPRLCEIVIAIQGEMILCPKPFDQGKRVAFRPANNPPLHEDRSLHTLDFANMSLMCVAGARIVDDGTTSDGKLYSYLRYEHPTSLADDMRIRVNRIVIDAPSDQAVGFVVRKAFRNYCRDNLKLRAPMKGMKEPKLGREAAIKLARSLYESNRPAALADLSADEYEALIREVFAAADRFHG